MGEVSCESLRAEIQAGEWPEGPEVEAHIGSCATCADELLSLGEQASAEDLTSMARGSAAAPDGLSTLQAEVEARQAQERGPLAWLRSRPAGMQRGLTLALSLSVVLAVWAFKRRADWNVYPTDRLAAELAGLVLLLVVVSRIALRPISLPERPYGSLLALAAGVVGLIVITGLPPAHAAHPASLEGLGAELVPRATACLLFGSLCALPVLALFLASDRAAGTVRRTVRLSAVGATLVGVLALQVHCPIVHVEHLRAGHTTVLAIMLIAGVVYSALSSSRASSSRASASK